MKELKPQIHENGIDYILVGDDYVPDWKLPEERRPAGIGADCIKPTCGCAIPVFTVNSFSPASYTPILPT